MQVVDHSSNPRETWRPGVETRMLVSASNGAAQLCIFEQWIAPGTGAPTHSHPVEEVLTVREGEAEMWMDEQRIIVPAGQSLIVPAGRKHGFRNSGNGHAAHSCGAGLAGFRIHAGGCDGSGAKVGCRVSARVVGFRSLDLVPCSHILLHHAEDVDGRDI